MHQMARNRAGVFLVGGILAAGLFLFPQYTYAYTGVCKYFNVILTPFGLCDETVEIETPAPIPENQPVEVAYEPESPIAATVRAEPNGVVAGTSSTQMSITTEEPVVVYQTDPAWRDYAADANRLFSGIVSYLISSDRESGNANVVAGNDDYITREFLLKQTDRIYDSKNDSISDLRSDLDESFTTDLLTVTGNGTLTGYLTADSYVAAPYLTATDAAATSTLTNLSVTGGANLGGSLTLAALGGGLLTTDANGVISTTTIGAASVTDDSLDFNKFVDAFILDATASFNLDTNGADWNIDNGTFFVDSSANNIGIGTTGPSAKLSVESSTGGTAFTVSTHGGAYKAMDVGSSGTILYNNGSNSFLTAGTFSVRGNDNVSIGNAGTVNNKLEVNGSVAIGNSYMGIAAPSNGMIVQGNVGIGTTTPNSKLHVIGDIELGQSGTSAGIIRFNAGGTGIPGLLTYSPAGFNMSATAGDDRNVTIVNGAFGTGNTMGLLVEGNVGIGTTTPEAKLQVSGKTVLKHTGSNSLNLYQFGSNAPALMMYHANGTESAPSQTLAGDVVGGINMFGYGTTNYSGGPHIRIRGIATEDNLGTSNRGTDLTFETVATGGVTVQERMRIMNSGNVGIGTTTPSAKLTVKGSGTGSGLLAQFTDSTNDPKVTILDNGNVGIGTASPGEKLHVSGGHMLLDNNYYLLGKDSGGTERTLIGMSSSNYTKIGDTSSAETIVLKAGNVGIGTTSPAYKLDILGSVRTHAGQGIYTGLSSLAQNANGLLVFGGDNGGTVYARGDVAGSDNNLTLQAFDDINFNTFPSGSPVTGMVLNKNGNVGIGITSPDNLLHVDQSSNAVVGDKDTYGFMLSKQGAEQVSIGSDASYNYIQSWSSKPLLINNLGNNTVLNPSTGNVGIGTTTPPYKLSVEGGDISFDRTQRLRLLSETTGNTAAAIGGNTNNDLIFYTNGGSEQMRITSLGNVGIGTTSPSHKLHVYGPTLIGSQTTNVFGQLLNVDGHHDTGYVAAISNAGGSGNASGLHISGVATMDIGLRVQNGKSIFDGNVGIGTTSPSSKLSVSGDVTFAGLTGATGAGSLCLNSSNEVVYNSGSDACLPSLRETKHDIATLDLAALAIVNDLDPVSFVYNQGDGRTRYGFIAEDTADIDAILATYDAEGNISGIDDRSMIAVVVSAVQELWTEVREYFARTEALEAEVDALQAENEAFKARFEALEAELDMRVDADEEDKTEEEESEDDAGEQSELADNTASSSQETDSSTDETNDTTTSSVDEVTEGD